jgi:hypothetical protein
MYRSRAIGRDWHTPRRSVDLFAIDAPTDQQLAWASRSCGVDTMRCETTHEEHGAVHPHTVCRDTRGPKTVSVDPIGGETECEDAAAACRDSAGCGGRRDVNMPGCPISPDQSDARISRACVPSVRRRKQPGRSFSPLIGRAVPSPGNLRGQACAQFGAGAACYSGIVVVSTTPALCRYPGACK